MSHDALAAKAGYDRAFIILIELGKTNPSLRSIFDICTSLDIKPSVFLRQVERRQTLNCPGKRVYCGSKRLAWALLMGLWLMSSTRILSAGRMRKRWRGGRSDLAKYSS